MSVLPEGIEDMIMAPHLSHLTKDLRGHSHLTLLSHIAIVVTMTLIHLSHVTATFHHPVLEYVSQSFAGFVVAIIAGYLKSQHFFVQNSPISVVSNSIIGFVTSVVIIIGGVSIAVVSESSRAENDRCEKQKSHGQGNLS